VVNVVVEDVDVDVLDALEQKGLSPREALEKIASMHVCDDRLAADEEVLDRAE
jgi:hypothetical protein